MNENEDDADLLKQQEESDLSRHGQPGYASVWRPVMTEQERAEREKQIEEGTIPF